MDQIEQTDKTTILPAKEVGGSKPQMSSFMLSVGLLNLVVILLWIVLTMVALHLSLDDPKAHEQVHSLFIKSFVGWVMCQVALLFLFLPRIVERSLSPLRLILKRVAEGNFSKSVLNKIPYEYRTLRKDFEYMLLSLKDIHLYRQKVEQQLVKAEERLRWDKALREKTEIIERMNHELSQAFHDISLLYTVSQYLGAAVDVDEVSQGIQNIFGDKFVCDGFFVYLHDPKSQELRLETSGGPIKRESQTLKKLAQATAEHSIKKSKSVVLDDLSTLRQRRSVDEFKDLNGLLMVAPMLIGQQVIGAVVVYRKSFSKISSAERQSFEAIVRQMAGAYDRAILHTQTKELSDRDELTQIYNRRYFQKSLKIELKRAERARRQVSLLMVDADHFKQYNDTHGHLQGDLLLKRLARLMQDNLREGDILARYGGEEFVIILVDADQAAAQHVAEKIRQLVYEHFYEQDKPGVTVSVGHATYPQMATEPIDLIDKADQALYLAKNQGRNRVVGFDTEIPPKEDRIVH